MLQFYSRLHQMGNMLFLNITEITLEKHRVPALHMRKILHCYKNNHWCIEAKIFNPYYVSYIIVWILLKHYCHSKAYQQLRLINLLVSLSSPKIGSHLSSKVVESQKFECAFITVLCIERGCNSVMLFAIITDVSSDKNTEVERGRDGNGMGILLQFPNDGRSRSVLPDHFVSVMKPCSCLKGKTVT